MSKVRVFATGIHFHTSLIVAIKNRAYQSEATRLHSDRILALPANIRQVWKWMKVTNALAYYGCAALPAIKSFIVQASEVRVCFICKLKGEL